MGTFSTAQICANGHCMDAYYQPGSSEKFCSKCGAEGIIECPKCHAQIHGKESIPGAINATRYVVPNYCYNCGAPYPWTSSAIEALALLVEEEDELSDTDKKKLIESLPELTIEGPKTTLAAARVQKALLVAGKFTADALRQFVIDFGSEVAVKYIGV